MTDGGGAEVLRSDSTLLGKLMVAKSWGGKFYEKAVKSGEQMVKNLTEQVNIKEIKDKVSDVVIFREFDKAQQQFELENLSKSDSIEFTHYSDNSTNPHLPPWDPYISGISDPTAVGTLRERILALSLQPNNFLIDPPAEAQIKWTTPMPANYLQEAKTLLEYDPNLNKIRYKLVPSKIQEDKFWRNYFYRLSLIRQSVQLSAMGGGAAGDTGTDESGSSETDYICVDESSLWSKSNNNNNTNFNESKSRDCSSSTSVTVPKTEQQQQALTGVNNKNKKKDANVVNKLNEAVMSNYASSEKFQDLEEEIAREVDELVFNEVENQQQPDSLLIDEIDNELEMELLAELNEQSR